MDGDIRLGTHVDTGAALAVEIVQTLEAFLNINTKTLAGSAGLLLLAYLAAGAVWVEITFARLKQHTLGDDGGTHGLVTSQGRAGQEDEADQEDGDHQQTMRLHVWALDAAEMLTLGWCQLMGSTVGTEQ